ncbi:MAG: hypothetical protein U0798_03520 [Gemmataceae bacterium]
MTTATGCCCQCGRQIIEFSVQNAQPSHTLEEIMENVISIEQLARQVAYIMFLTMFWWVILFITPLVFGKNLAWVQNDIMTSLPVILFLWFAVAWYHRTKRSYHCEHCRLTIYKDYELKIALTGRCPNCAKLIVKNLGLPANNNDAPRLNIDTFRSDCNASRRRSLLPFFWAFIWICLLLVTTETFKFLFPDYQDKVDAQVGAVNGVIVVTVVKFILMLLSIVPMVRAIVLNSRAIIDPNSNAPGLNCPHCHKTIFNHEIAIATKRCHHCREIVFNEPAPLPEEGNGTWHAGLV